MQNHELERSARTSPDRSRLGRRLGTTTVATLALTAGALPQDQGPGPGVTFSIDYIGSTIAVPDSVFGVPITEADILAPLDPAGTRMPVYGPLPPPYIATSGGFGPPAPGLMLPLHAGCIGHPPGTVCRIELDALSYGRDGLLEPIDYDRKGKVLFSVDRCATGIPGTPLFPNVNCEGMGFGAREAQADAFMSIQLRLSIFPPPAVVIGNTGSIDGNGLVSVPVCAPSGTAYPGLGLVEPFPFPGPVAPFDNLDALDTEGLVQPPDDTTFPASGIYFSLDNGVVDPCTASAGFGPSFSAAANGPFVGGDVLVKGPGAAAPVVYAPALVLGLDLFGPDTDDLDALALFENGMPGYQPSMEPYDWLGGGSDMLLFSVRRGSAIIGTPDSCSGRPIEPGDVLTPGPAGGPPCIVIPAEQLGLSTMRSGVFGQFADDLDALDVRHEPQRLITHGACYGTFGSCPCANDDPAAGCMNSTGVGGILRPAGSSSVGSDDLVLTASQLPPGNQGLFYMGDTIVNAVFFDGLQCALGTTFRFLGSIQNTGVAGTMVLGPGNAAASGGLIVPGTTWYFQAWHRDIGGPCGTGANLSHAIGVCFEP